MALGNPNHHYGRYSPHSPTQRDNLFDDFDNVFEIPSAWLAEMTRGSNATTGHSMEIVDNVQEFKINLPIDDYKPDELNVRLIRDRFVTIEGKKQEKREHDGEEGFVTNIVTKQFNRSFVLPRNVDANKVRSNFGNGGILSIQAPKVHQKAIMEERRIPIE